MANQAAWNVCDYSVIVWQLARKMVRTLSYNTKPQYQFNILGKGDEIGMWLTTDSILTYIKVIRIQTHNSNYLNHSNNPHISLNILIYFSINSSAFHLCIYVYIYTNIYFLYLLYDNYGFATKCPLCPHSKVLSNPN